ncbi:hypothetical protein [Streptomyces sp. CRN 30]|uniref:hypothetical protein n=1 Tax=Streptomyces sp. CRN 30 TaxID=3075613 RepID=UPI002A814B23|nr:hypothetical protein [Streptomyces sp. CRN 30]
MLRSRLTTRSARLFLATAAAAVALTATATTAATAGTASTTPRACTTGDLTFKVTAQTQAGGYDLVTAKAKKGVTCVLEGVYPSASYGSSAATEVGPAEQAVSDDIVLTGSKAAYAGISPKSTNNNHGIEFDRIHLSVTGDEANAVTLVLPDTVLVDRPVATNWHADRADAVPFV